MMSEGRQVCSFQVDGLLWGVDAEKVQEVIGNLTITRVPSAPPSVRGLVNLRGQIVTAIEVRRCLGLPDRPANRIPIHLVLRTADGLVSLLVDEIGVVLDLSEDAFAFSPETLQGRLRELVLEAHKLENRLLLVLDTERLLREVSAIENVSVGVVPGDAR